MNRALKILAPVIAAIFVVGCQSARVAEPLTKKLGGGEVNAQMEFWHELQGRPITCNDEAFHGLLLYVDGTDPNADYASRVSFLKSRKMIPANFDRPADEAVARGTLAVGIVQALQIKGGVAMLIAGNTPRYATRELQFVGIYPPSSPQQTFSGTEFLGIMGRVEDWQRGNSADKPAEYLPSQPATRPADE